MIARKLMVFALLAVSVWLLACSKSSRDSQAQSSAASNDTAANLSNVMPGPSIINNDDVPFLTTATSGQSQKETVPLLEAPGNSSRPASDLCVDEEKFRTMLAAKNVEKGSDDARARRVALENAMHPQVMELVACLDAISRQLHRMAVENELSGQDGGQDIAAGQAAAMRHYESLMEIRSGQDE